MLFIFDENFPPALAAGFSILESANKRTPFPVTVMHAIDFMDRDGALDEEIIAAADQKNAVIITQDSDFKRIKHYKPLLIQHKVGYVYFKVPSGKYTYWEIVTAFISKWEDLKMKISTLNHPFAIEINKQGHISSTTSF